MGLIEILIAAAIAVIGAFFGGRFIGSSKARADAAASQYAKDAKRITESNQKAIDAQSKVINESVEVRDEISNLKSGDALDELRREYARDKNGNKNN